MELGNTGKRIFLLAAPAALCAVTVWGLSGTTSPDTGPNVTFIASGTFATPQVSGDDTLKLAGEPFTINIVAPAGSVPVKHGPNWAVLSPFKMTGTVHSGLLGSEPINIASTGASIFEEVGPDYDPFETGFPVKVVGISLTIQAQFTLPPGTFTKPLIHPFAAVALAPGNTTVVYSNGSDSTTLTIESGSLVATLAGGGAGAGR
jgi:hypothetical protein